MWQHAIKRPTAQKMLRYCATFFGPCRGPLPEETRPDDDEGALVRPKTLNIPKSASGHGANASGVANVNWGPRFPFPSLSFHFCLALLFSFLFILLLPLPFLPSKVRPSIIWIEGLGKRCKLPQRDLGQRPERNRIWFVTALKCEICWQQF